jgi:hypothetical protein
MKIIISLQKPLQNYTFGYSLYESPDTATWYDSNIINISNSGTYYIFVKNKTTGFVEKTKKVFISCLNGSVVCTINYTVVRNLSVCTINTIPVNSITSINNICKLNYTPIIAINQCKINYIPSKKLN